MGSAPRPHINRKPTKLIKPKLSCFIPLVVFALAGSSFVFTNSSQAADGSWTGITSGAWLTPTNWTGSVIPGSTALNTDIATFNAAANPIADPAPGFTVTFPTATEVKHTFPAGTTNFARLKVTGP